MSCQAGSTKGNGKATNNWAPAVRNFLTGAHSTTLTSAVSISKDTPTPLNVLSSTVDSLGNDFFAKVLDDSSRHGDQIVFTSV